MLLLLLLLRLLLLLLLLLLLFFEEVLEESIEGRGVGESAEMVQNIISAIFFRSVFFDQRTTILHQHRHEGNIA